MSVLCRNAPTPTPHVMPQPSDPSNPPLVAAQHAADGKYHLLLAASGSVATIKLPNMIAALEERCPHVSIRVILTQSATHFLQGQSAEQPSIQYLRSRPNVAGVHVDADEWEAPGWTRGAAILHIELRRWADALVVAPLSANTLAKLAAGLCDNLLTSVVRAWQVEDEASLQRRIIVAPAMNTAMWRHPLTASHLHTLEKFHWMRVLPPAQGKTLACGDTGAGAMCEWSEIVDVVAAEVADRGVLRDRAS